jgi:hypothetical protein
VIADNDSGSRPDEPTVVNTTAPTPAPTEAEAPDDSDAPEHGDDSEDAGAAAFAATCDRLRPLVSGWDIRFARATDKGFERLAAFLDEHAAKVDSVVRRSRLPVRHQVIHLAEALADKERALLRDLAALVANQPAYERAYSSVLKPVVRLQLNACSPLG